MQSLFDISREYAEAFERMEINEETGEVLGLDAVEALNGAFEEKAESVACYIKNLEAFARSLKEEEAKMAERRKSADRKIDSLKKYLTSCMESVERDTLETAKVRVSFRKSVSVTIADEKLLPLALIRETIKLEPDKTAIKKLLQSGEAVEGASLVESRNIQIK